MTARTPELAASLRRLAAGAAIVLLALVPLSACNDSDEAPGEGTDSESMMEDGEEGMEGDEEMGGEEMGGEEGMEDGSGSGDMGGDDPEDR